MRLFNSWCQHTHEGADKGITRKKRTKKVSEKRTYVEKCVNINNIAISPRRAESADQHTRDHDSVNGGSVCALNRSDMASQDGEIKVIKGVQPVFIVDGFSFCRDDCKHYFLSEW